MEISTYTKKGGKNNCEYKKLKMVIMYVDFQVHLPKDCKIQLPVDPVVLSLFSEWLNIYVFGRSYVHLNKCLLGTVHLIQNNFPMGGGVRIGSTYPGYSERDN